ncbi:hypothetical protein PV392_27535 [Streptomyces sp. ME03-5709C]|nr:hypothetical protein [Streptomyces sp. ME03-5709C]
MNAPRPPAMALTVAPSRVRSAWCGSCKAYTLLAGDLVLLTPEGVSTLGTWTWCEVCDDPADQTDTRRPRHAR